MKNLKTRVKPSIKFYKQVRVFNGSDNIIPSLYNAVFNTVTFVNIKGTICVLLFYSFYGIDQKESENNDNLT